MTINSFFAGIGGFDLGFEKEGFSVQFQCELNKFCTSVLEHHWPNVPLEEDIRELSIDKVPEATIWCGGFPCQDVSVARGSKGREGLKGQNSGLFYDFLSLVEEGMPKVILLENVKGLLSSHNGKDFKLIIQSLTELGYGVSWRILNTRFFGAPQSRPRVYICAWHGSPENATYALHEFEKAPKPDSPRKAFLKANRNKASGVIVPELAYCLAATSGRHTGTDWSRTYVSYFDQVRRVTPIEAEKLQGFPKNWTLPANFREKYGEIDSQRYHAAGNAVSVPIVRWIASRIKDRLSLKNGHAPFDEVIEKFEDFRKAERLVASTLDELPEDSTIKWKSGGVAFKESIFQSPVHSCPTKIISSRLIDIIEKKEIDQKYFLSPTAAVGILRRVDSQKRVLFGPLKEALVRLSKEFTENNVLLSR